MGCVQDGGYSTLVLISTPDPLAGCSAEGLVLRLVFFGLSAPATPSCTGDVTPLVASLLSPVLLPSGAPDPEEKRI